MITCSIYIPHPSARFSLGPFIYGRSCLPDFNAMAAKENYDISTSDLTGRRSASELLGNIVVPKVGLEPTHLSVADFESAVSAVSPFG